MFVAVQLTPADFFSQASLEAVPTALIGLTLGLYLLGVLRLRSKGRVWPWARTASFVLGELLLVVALLSGLAAYDDSNFTIHTVQHIFIGMLAPIFLVLSAPVTLLLQASPRKVQTSVLRVIHSWFGKLLSNPLLTWPLYGGSLFALYFTSLYPDSLQNVLLHNFIHLDLVLTGYLFFLPVMGVDPLPRRFNFGARIGYLMLALPFHTILGLALESQSTPIAPGISVTDLHTGGALMWIAGEGIGLVATLAVFVQWLRADERDARRIDREHEASYEKQLALWRASREAAAKAAQASTS
jgi:putative copper resistance protein D